MKNTIKTVITVLVVVGCGFISLISFGVYLSETDYMEYEIGRMVSPVFNLMWRGMTRARRCIMTLFPLS